MRKQSEILELKNKRLESRILRTKEVDFTNSKGERFIYLNGRLVSYTDTRVIYHDTNRLVDLSQKPFEN